MNVLSIENIQKTFGTYKAVNNVSFDVPEGRIFGLLGPNGAGKTTTIRMINNILMPDSGSISIMGEPVSSKMQNRIGYLPEERGLYKKLKVSEQLIYFAQLKGLSKSDAIQKYKFWLDKMGALGWDNKKIQELSKGMQQKVQFISTILHDPALYILDEPFSGFDPINTELMKGIILELKSQGKTIILSTHVMEQVEQLCDEICLINKGRVVLSGNVREIKKSYGRDTGIIEFNGDDSFINGFDDIKITNRNNHRIEFRILNKELDTSKILKKAIEKADVHKFQLDEPTLNEIFIDSIRTSSMQDNQGGENE